MERVWKNLYEAAKAVQDPRDVSERIYAGGMAAAIESASGKIYTGVSVDTSCTLGICAERNDRPTTTLFMLMSVDGKISTGSTDELDVDRDFPSIPGVGEGLHQYYEIEQTTSLWSFSTGRVQAKMGVNEKEMTAETPVSFVLLDNHHLTERGVRYFCAKSKQAVVITSNASHPAFHVDADNLHIIYQERPSLRAALERLRQECGCERLTVQSGGTVNGLFLREKLLDHVDVVVAPVLIGGKDTPTLIDGRSLTSASELSQLGALELTECTVLQGSYIRLRYKVLN